MDPAAAARFAGLALKCLHDEYPNHISLTMDRDSDAHPPRELTPAFYGCFLDGIQTCTATGCWCGCCA